MRRRTPGPRPRGWAATGHATLLGRTSPVTVEQVFDRLVISQFSVRVTGSRLTGGRHVVLLQAA